MQVDDDVIGRLARAEFDGCRLRISEQLDAPIASAINGLVEAAGGTWQQHSNAWVFDVDAYLALEPVFTQGRLPDLKDRFEFFEAPDAVVSLMLARARLIPGKSVLEPSAGRGRIARRLMDAGLVVNAIDIQPHLVQQMRDVGIADVACRDFLAYEPWGRQFDRIVMYPPCRAEQDIRHVEHALTMLRPEGTLVAVMCAGTAVRSSRTAQDFRRGLLERGGTIERLPVGVLRAAGGDVAAVLVTIPGAAPRERHVGARR